MPTRLALSFAAAAVLLVGCGNQGSDVGPVVLTIGPPYAPAEAAHGLFGNWGVNLEGAVGLSLADLRSLPARDIAARFPAEGALSVYSGPRLSAVLARAGAEGAGARLTAFDGYQVDVTAEMIAAHEPVLALRADEEPLAIGGYGPVMLVWPRETEPSLSDMTDDLWPWGVFAIAVLDRAQDD